MGVSLAAAGLGVLALVGDANAGNLNTHGAAFQAYNAGQANDLDYYPYGVRASASSARHAIASVTRSPNPTDYQVFSIQGTNSSGQTTYFTLYAYDLNGNFRASVSLESSDANYTVGSGLSVGGYNDDVYVSVLALLPASYGGAVHGITAYQW
jgi:hypothetical protein